ncbi:MAG: radical SAM protein [Firmicutes bacterium]|nr:radical SAM protein [Bacillota bacterium]
MSDELTLLASCRLCPRACGVNRLRGEKGWCGAGRLTRVARAALHHWEEPAISGTRGSGTVFFAHCNLRCLYCQNHELSWGGFGVDLSPAELAEIFLRLAASGAHNITLVTPPPYIPQIAVALRLARARGLDLPVVYNTGSYELPFSLALLRDLVDVFLPDLKYADAHLAQSYSQAPGYFATATAAIRAMRELAPADRFTEEGIMVSGLLVRHLVLPGHLENTRRVLRWIAAELGRETYVSLMAQYTLVFRAVGHPLLGRRLRPAEYEAALAELFALGLENGFCQDLDAANSSFTPAFDLTGVLPLGE